MFDFLTKTLAKRERKRKAIEFASRYFETISGQKVILSMCKIIATEDDRCVVRLCCGNSRPPQRKYYAVYDRSGEVTELTFDEASAKYDEKPWR